MKFAERRLSTELGNYLKVHRESFESLGRRLGQYLARMEPFVSTKQVAQFLGLAPRTVVRMAREGRIPAHPVSGTVRRTWRFKLSEVGNHFASLLSKPTIAAGVQVPAERQQ
jgi:excisionase family DNA binding protein